MTVLKKEKAIYTIQAFIMFLNITKETEGLNAGHVGAYKEDAVALLEKVIADHLDPHLAAGELNQLIEKMNQLLTAPYPHIILDSEVNLMKGEIVAFEHYLHQELKANHLSLQQEAPLFNASLQLWEKVGVSLTMEQGASEFAALVEKLNRFLPKEEQYPIPRNDH